MAKVDNAPCKDCPDRYPGCHSKCERYLELRARLDARNEQRRKARESYIDWLDMKKSNHYKKEGQK